MRSFFSELKRRNVYKVGAMYAVAGWLLVQIVTQVFPVFEVTALVQRIIVLVIVAGFPIALVLSWVYEITPEGIVKTNDVQPGGSIARRTGQRLNYVITGFLVLAVAFLLAQRYLFPMHAAAASGAVEKSIAVLPFANLSEEKSNEYFAEGIQDEILTRLAKIGSLKVISRTSTQRYASAPANLPEIGKQLGVANILEGSVQKIGDAVHINVQLIRAATDDHVWAEIYNRKVSDIFTVQGEVSAAIAQALNAKLTGAEQLAVSQKPTDNAAAYDAFLRGRSLWTRGYDFSNTRKAAEAYAETVRLDPKFASAWATLSTAAGYMYFNNVDRDKYTADLIKNAAERAAALEPESSEAAIAIGSYRYRVLRDFEGARQAFQTAAQRAPNESRAWQYLALVERRQGHWDDALEHFNTAMNLDPLNAGLMTTIGGETLLNMRRYEDARRWLDRALNLSPESATAVTYKAWTFEAQGHLDEAARILAGNASAEPIIVSQRIYQHMLEHDFAHAISEAQAALAQPGDLDGYRPLIQLNLAHAQAYAGDSAAARATLAELIAHLKPLRDQVDDSLIPITLAMAMSAAGDPGALEQAQRAGQQFANDANNGPYALDALAQAQIASGDKKAAIDTVRRGLSVESGIAVAFLKFDPVWDPLRSEAAFQTLLKE